MKLSEKLDSLTKENTVDELSIMLSFAQVSISWWGQRLVTVDGYEGSVAVDELASKYLKAEPFQSGTKASLVDRLACESLWDRVKQLYTKSDKDLAGTRVYGYLVPIREFPLFSDLLYTKDIIREELGGKRASLFNFTPAEFKKYWSPLLKYGISFTAGQLETERWAATKEMVERAVVVGPLKVATK